jgi:hypothetical protein
MLRQLTEVLALDMYCLFGHNQARLAAMIALHLSTNSTLQNSSPYISHFTQRPAGEHVCKRVLDYECKFMWPAAGLL